MNKIIQFLLEAKHELSRVVWPSRKDTIRYTGLVILVSAIIAIVLGAADYGLTQAIEKVINQ